MRSKNFENGWVQEKLFFPEAGTFEPDDEAEDEESDEWELKALGGRQPCRLYRAG